MSQKRMIFEGVAQLVLLVALMGISVYLPVLSVLSVWFLPFPLMYFSAKFGWRQAIVLLTAGLVLPFVFVGYPAGLVLVFFILCGYAMGTAINLGKSALTVLFSGSLVNIAVLIGYLALSVLVFHFNPVDAVRDSLMNAFHEMPNQVSRIMGGNTEQLRAYYRDSINYLSLLAPAFIVVAGAFYALITGLIHLPILRRLNVQTPNYPPFRDWQLPRVFVWIYLTILLILLFGNPESADPFFIGAINLRFILDILFVVQGFSFIFFLSYAKGIAIAVPILVSIGTIVFSFFLQLVQILGIIDLGFNLRRYIKKK